MVFTGNKYPEVHNEVDQSIGNDDLDYSDHCYIDSGCTVIIDIPKEFCCLIGDPPIFYYKHRLGSCCRW